MKYTLIISQYYHSRHNFIIKFPEENFYEIMKKFIEELEDYKRGYKDKYEYGDIGYLEGKEIRYRYNVNDAGDIYIINSDYINNLLGVAEEYRLKTYRETRQYIKKNILKEVSEFHDYDKIRKIVEKYFELA